MDPPDPAIRARRDDLLEIVHAIRTELLLREESPTGNWIDETVDDLASGRKPGWYYPPSVGGGLAFATGSRGDEFGHVHVGPGANAAARARRLAESLLDGIAPTVATVDVGFTGLDPSEERTVLDELTRRPGSRTIERASMGRALGPADGEFRPVVPEGLRLVPIRGVTVDSLAELDFRSFRGTVDALLIGRDVTQYRRVLSALLDGQMGRFLDEASTALYRPDPPALLGAILTAERSARRAVFVDFMVDPEERHRGYGAFLFRWGLRALRALGYERVGLWVTWSNEPARRLYEEAGFTVTARAAVYRWERPSSPTPQAHASR